MENKSENNIVVPKRILSSLLSSVSAGVVPRSGAPYIAIGRKDEIAAILSDLEQVSEGGAGMRFLIGRYGSGKSFLIQLIRGYALERDFITADIDLTPERRLYGSHGSGVAVYRGLTKNMASRSSPDGGAISKMIARWISDFQSKLTDQGVRENSEDFYIKLNKMVYQEIRDMEFLVGGFDFSKVISEYYKAYVNDDKEKMSACLRFLRGEYSNKTEARVALGFNVSTIIDDENWYDYLKLWASLTRKMGYRGLVVFIDECVNLYKISNRISRENNYEKILSMFNDTLQGGAEGLEIIFAGTPQFLEDTRRGLFSYEALRSRLCDSRFALDGFKNLIGPVIRLKRLTDEELFALIVRITNLYSSYYNWTPRITEEEQVKFLQICLERTGADIMITPREMLRDYMTVLNILMQNEDAKFDDIVGVAVKLEHSEPDGEEETAKPKDQTQKREVTLKDLDF